MVLQPRGARARRRPEKLQTRLPALRPRSSRDSPAAGLRRVQFFSGPAVGAHCRILLPILRRTDGDGVPAARPPAHLGHRNGSGKSEGTAEDWRVQNQQAAAQGFRMNSIDIDVGGTFTDLVLNY